MPTTIKRESLPPDLLSLCRQLDEAGYRAWIVGGCVRDLLRGVEVNDWDVATDARPEQVTKVFKRVAPTGIKHGTVTVLLVDNAYEVTTLRGERGYSDGRRPDEVFFVDDIDADLARRDFTVNAIALDPVTDTLVDPFGGMRDLEGRTLRAVGVPKERFNEDGLRILRGARFVATLGFELEPETEAAFEGALDVYKKVSHERVRDEWLKTMKATKPSRAFEVMRRTGILSVTFPEMMEQVGCAQNAWHAYDVWDHTMAVLDALQGDEVDKVAALLHDVGKPRTRQHSDKTNDWTFYHHEKVGADMADRWLRDYKFSNAERERVVGLVRHHLICYESSWSDAAVRRFIKRVGKNNVVAQLELGRADAIGKGKPAQEHLALLDELADRIEAEEAKGGVPTTKDLAIDGSTVSALMTGGPGPAVGALMRELLERVIEDPTLNTEEKLLTLSTELAPEFEKRFPGRR